MKYRVTILPRAKRQLYEAALWWAEQRSPEQASSWLNGFELALSDLVKDPQRHGLARENSEFSFGVRQLLFGLGTTKTHRAVFTIHDDEVIVHAIRHVAQQDLSSGDIETP